MRAIVKSKSAAGLWLESVPEPHPGPGEVLIKVRRAGICGTDLHIYKWNEWAQSTIPVPLTIGHEFYGEIVGLGAGVPSSRLGERVSAEGHVSCGRCRNCLGGREHLCRDTKGLGISRPGGFAEYAVVPERNCYPVPASFPESVAAILDPLGNAVHAALSFDLVGEDVLVTGAGPIGLFAIAIARRCGARCVVASDPSPHRRALAELMGAHMVIDPTTQNLSDAIDAFDFIREGFDIGLEMSGSSAALNSMIESLCNGGKVSLLGIPSNSFAIDWTRIVFKGLTIKGIYGREMYETWYKSVALVQGGLDVSPAITDLLPADDFEQGFERMLTGQSGKVVLDWAA